ncbi:hypothetical protein [Actinacidiphila oryziradicis]|uniref:Uncharacterized protein n=1 Tax=Actinacidiphila oryziradicis TaxID=2571141 RepID=A0A4U0RHI1_9ACTN|nr:hypothetical protein [Actinacidiphila oryziradicis]TJZ95059.1 hypothetical protein FCI23_52580 [Actinacidiphila oryziradicis]
MKYTVVPWRDSNDVLRGFAIWDDEISPGLKEAGLRPYCSLNGVELVFMRFTQGWQWIADCMARGLDMGTPGMTIRTYNVGPGGGVVELGKYSKNPQRGSHPLHNAW